MSCHTVNPHRNGRPGSPEPAVCSDHGSSIKLAEQIQQVGRYVFVDGTLIRGSQCLPDIGIADCRLGP